MSRRFWGERMELKIKCRDYVPDGVGGLQRVSGKEELLQRTLFRLTARRGGFALAPTLGSRLYLLGREKPGNRLTAAKKYVAEALDGEMGVTVEDVSLAHDGEMSCLRVKLRYEGEGLELTVPMEGESGI